MNSSSRVVRSTVLGLAACVMVSACAAGPGAPRPAAARSATDTSTAGLQRVVNIDFEKAPGPMGAPVGSFAQYRTSAIAVDVVALGGAASKLVYTPGVGGGHAISFPSRAAIGKERVALRILTLTDPDPLSPGRSDFTFGADIRIDDPSSADDGDNVLQRGLFSDTSQYKIQLDDHRPSCRVAGNEGEVTVKATDTLPTGQWYRIRCTREGNKVVLSVGAINEAGDAPNPTVFSDFRPTGSVAILRTSTPLSVGGKVTATGDVVESNTDQFNGSIDNVFFEVFGSGDGANVTPAPRATASASAAQSTGNP